MKDNDAIQDSFLGLLTNTLSVVFFFFYWQMKDHKRKKAKENPTELLLQKRCKEQWPFGEMI